jgi:hypothetical protein
VDRGPRVVAFACVLTLALAALVLVADVLSAFGLPALYGVAATSAAGAVVIAAYLVLFDGRFDDAGYLDPGRVGVDAALVAGSALLVAAALVYTMASVGVVDAGVVPGGAFVAAGPRLVATVGGIGAGLYALYRRNRGRFGR